MAQLSKVLKVVCWAGSVPFPPVSLQRQVLFNCCGWCSCFHQGRAYTVSWLVGVQIKVIATSDLWLFIHASKLLSLNSPSPLPYIEKGRSTGLTQMLFSLFRQTFWGIQTVEGDNQNAQVEPTWEMFFNHADHFVHLKFRYFVKFHGALHHWHTAPFDWQLLCHVCVSLCIYVHWKWWEIHWMKCCCAFVYILHRVASVF